MGFIIENLRPRAYRFIYIKLKGDFRRACFSGLLGIFTYIMDAAELAGKVSFPGLPLYSF
jgi:hypothetical protein